MRLGSRKILPLAAALIVATVIAIPCALAQNADPPAATRTAVDQFPNPCGPLRKAPLPNFPSWPGWSVSPENWRFQPAKQADLSAANVANLKLKWAFGIPNVKIVRSQPAEFLGQVIVGANDGTVYSLDFLSGCIDWATTVSKPVRSGIAVGKAGDADAVFFGDAGGNVYSLDVGNGKLLWAMRADDHPNATITGTPAWYDNRLYVPISSGEEGARRRPEYECCTFRGSVVALDAATGKKIWQSYMATDAPAAVGKTKDGHNIFAPSGMAIWSAPTIDVAKNRMYVGTGDNYSEPDTRTSDAVVALDLKTGAILWSVQFDKDDVYKIDCGDPPREGCSPPTNPEFPPRPHWDRLAHLPISEPLHTDW